MLWHQGIRVYEGGGGEYENRTGTSVVSLVHWYLINVAIMEGVFSDSFGANLAWFNINDIILLE